MNGSHVTVFPVESRGVFLAVEHSPGMGARWSGLLAQLHRLSRSQSSNHGRRLTQRPGT